MVGMDCSVLTTNWTERETDGQVDERSPAAHRQRNARAVQQSHDLTASQAVATNPEGRCGKCRRRVAVEQVLLRFAIVEHVGAQHIRCCRQRHHHQQHGNCPDRDPVLS
jgi:hypothetical protein